MIIILPKKLKEYNELKIWTAWEYREDSSNGKKKKVPIGKTGKPISITDKSNLMTREEAEQNKDGRGLDGIGLVFNDDTDLVGVDLDNIIDEQGWISSEGMDIVKQLNSYTEVSPSKTGLHILVKGSIPQESKNRRGFVECYDKDRFFTVTGEVWGENDRIEERQQELNQFCKQYLMDQEQTDNAQPTDSEQPPFIPLGEQAFYNDPKALALYNGNIDGYNSQSEADLALCNKLVYYFGTKIELIDELFRSSNLMRKKWDRDDYATTTIKTAIEGVLSMQNMEKKEEVNNQINSTKELIDSDYYLTEIDLLKEYSQRKTGFDNLDENQIFQNGLYILGGECGTGKTTFCTQLADQLAERGEHIIYFSLEQSKLDLLWKSLTREANEDLKDLIKDDNQTDIQEVAQRYINKVGNRVNLVSGIFNITTSQIKKIVDDYLTKNKGVKPIVIIDYLQILQAEAKSFDKKDKIDNIIHELKQYQANNGITIIAISSLNRVSYNTKLTTASFKESGAIEYTCDVLWGLSEKEGDIVKLDCLKNRFGERYNSIEFEYIKQLNLFKQK